MSSGTVYVSTKLSEKHFHSSSHEGLKSLMCHCRGGVHWTTLADVVSPQG